MSKVLRRIMLAVLVIAGIIAGYRSIQDSTVPWILFWHSVRRRTDIQS